ncbi:MAG: nicotinate phosphoribosyltransferase [Gammaproteobacteria bacterium]|nr:MAG: nicotinate phosphoribosyltransferase [Gammaproteobacteria bacterium]
MSSNTSALLTDLYMLTMLQGYFEQGMEHTAVYEFFVRELPPGRGFLLAAGLEQVLEYLETLCFTDEELAWLADSGRFTPEFVDYLARLRFTGDVHAMPEGTVFFANEPIMRVTAPIPQAQFVETRIINLLHLETVLASKAARCVLAAPGKLLVDFGLRRAHGAEAGLLAARASYLAGFTGSATVLAGKRYGIPLFGTMAHSFIQAHDDELTAFEHFAYAQPDNVLLLIDTYDTEAGAQTVVQLAPRLQARGITIKGVRLDSGDLIDHAHKVRKILDAGGLTEARIFTSGDLDEYALRALLRKGAPIDGFGVGTRLDTSADAPYLDCAYKLVEYAGHPRRKRSEGKVTLPGRKQVYRSYETGGTRRMHGDVVTVEHDDQAGAALLQPVMRDGRRIHKPETLAASRERAAEQLSRLPPHLHNLDEGPAYPVRVSQALERLAREADRDVGAAAGLQQP